MSIKIKHKRCADAGKPPQPSDLEAGEIALDVFLKANFRLKQRSEAMKHGSHLCALPNSWLSDP